MERYTFCAKIGKIYDPDDLNKEYGFGEDTPNYKRFQKDTIYFREEKEKRIEYWDEEDKVSRILEDFLDLYDFKALALDEKKVKRFIDIYGLPYCLHKADDNDFFGLKFTVKFWADSPGFFYDAVSIKKLTNFYFFLRSLTNLATDESREDGMDIPVEKHCFRFSNMLYLLISPFMDEYTNRYTSDDIAENHIPEINKNKLPPPSYEEDRVRLFGPFKFENYRKALRKRMEEYRETGEEEKEKGKRKRDIGEECLSEDMFATTNVVDHKEKLERAGSILNFLRVVEKTTFFFNVDDQGCLINIDGYNDAFVDVDEADEGIIDEMVPLFVKDYLDYLIKGYGPVVINGPEGYALDMQLDTMGAIIFGLIYTLDSKKYMRKCPICRRFFYPARNHPRQRSCGHRCSDILCKRNKRAEKIVGVPMG